MPTSALAHRFLASSFAAAMLTSLSCAALASTRSDEATELPTQRGRDKLDVDYARDIHAHTTDPAYLSEWVDHLPVSRKLPSPKEFLGYSIGTPGRLTPPERVNEYFRALAESSKRIELFSMGRSHGGREMIVAAIGSKKNLRKLEEIKARNHELADPRVTDEARAREIAGSTPPIYWMTAGLHSPETGPPEMVMELAYRLAASEQDHIREIRDNVVVLITPVLEMDGRARMVDWYERYLTQVRDLEDSPPRSPPYWGDYTFHDNNRDGLQQSQALTRNYTETFHEFLPVLTLDLHESVPLLYVSTGTGPYNEGVDPITVTEWQWIASYEVATATKLGLQGVWTWGFYTGWYPGYILWVSNNHNATGRFYETFGNSNPNTFERELDGAEYAGARLNAKEWYRAWPPDKKVTWSLRNNTNYMQTAALASLQLAARHGEELLLNTWKKAQNGIEAGRSERPHAFLIPREGQRDAGGLRRLLELLAVHRIEVEELAAAGKFRGLEGPVEAEPGDFVVKLDQPYRNYAKTLLLAQGFPKTAKMTPYDDVAWSLDLMLGVEVVAIDDPEILKLDGRRLSSVPEFRFKAPAGTRWVVDHRGQASLASLRWALPESAEVQALTKEWQGHPAGSLLISGIDATLLDAALGPLALAAEALPDEGEVEVDTVELNVPRVAVFHTWRFTQDSGWLRFAFEALGIPYALIDKDDLRAGKLGERFDVIVIPNQGGMELKDIVHGIDPKWGPMPYTTTDEYPSHGIIDSSPDITGGMGFAGLGELQRFVEGGGVLLGLGSGGIVAAEGGIARGVGTSRPGTSPGSHLTTKVLRPEHPLAWGYGEVDWVFRGNLPVYEVREHDWGRTVMQFGTKTWTEVERQRDEAADVPVDAPELPPLEPAPSGDETRPGKKAKKVPLVRSGIVKKPDGIDHHPALLDVPAGEGRVVLFAWNPMHRYQNEHDFAFVTNALLFFDDFPEPPSRDEMRAREEPPKEG